MPLSFVPFLLAIIFFVVLLTLQIKSEQILNKIGYEKHKTTLNLLAILFLVSLTVLWRILFIYKFKTPQVTEFGIAFDMAKKWITGPFLSPEHLFSPRWGIYTLVLSKFLLLGKSLFIAKMSSVLAAAVSVTFIFLCLLKSTNKYFVAFIGGLLLALWPSFAIYSNILTSEHFFIMFFSISLFCLTYAISNYKSNRRLFFLFVFLFSIFISFANSFKDIAIISIPAAIIVFAYFVSKNVDNIKNKITNIILIGIILTSSMFIIGIARNSLVSYYAMGPVNESSFGYFLATGLNIENAGRYNTNIGEPAVQQLRNDLNNKKLSNEAYKQSDKKLMSFAIQEVKKDYKQLPMLFIKKFYTVWSNEDEINNLNYDAYTLSNSVPINMTSDQLKESLKELNLYSNSFFLLMMIFATLSVVFVVWNKAVTLTPDLYFSTILCVGFAAVLLLIEVLTRYRSVLYPAITIQAVFGIYFSSDYLKRIIT
ncbi:MAG: hypothetical protein WC437_02230 [Patescibacteria group bacterium]